MGDRVKDAEEYLLACHREEAMCKRAMHELQPAQKAASAAAMKAHNVWMSAQSDRLAAEKQLQIELQGEAGNAAG